MAEFAYTTVPGKIKPLLEKIRGVGIPPKATVQWLKTIGFKSSNDSGLLGMLKVAGLIDGSNVPTSTWSMYRGANHRAALGEALRIGYADLFTVYPDAWQRSNTELEHVFATSTNAGKQVISKTVASFKALCECADFAAAGEQNGQSMHTAAPLHVPVASDGLNPKLVTNDGKPSPSLHIDLQIHVSPEASPEQIDQIFKSMAKHLYGAKDA
jgi:hypothetical protein